MVWQAQANSGMVAASRRLAALGVAGLLAGGVVGCQPMPRSGGYVMAAPHEGYRHDTGASRAVSQGVVAAGVVPTPAGYDPMVREGLARVGTLEGGQNQLRERLDQVEKALLRLDRRMQLVERNELSRMGDAQSAAPNTLPPLASGADGGFQNAPAAALAAAPAPRSLVGVPQDEALGAFQTVSAAGAGIISSPLQAAPRPQAWQPAPASERVSGGLPSLADPEPAAGRAPTGTGEVRDVAIWTVRYEPEKVWPDRQQLPSSRDMVEALRERGALTIYARGPNPNAITFRNRVAALSRYLAKVSSQDTVPIATLSAPHLDADTIELLATP
jgi:hypothetical protein